MSEYSKFEVTRKEQMLYKAVMVNGFFGSGKTMLSPIISSFPSVEIMQYSHTIEHMCELSQLYKIEDDVAESMIRMNCDHLIYWVSMGREVNCRPSDLSSIFKNKPLRYIRRMLSEGDEKIPDLIKQNKPILNLATHALLPASNLLFKALLDKLVFIEIVRHPLYMIIQQQRNFEMFKTSRSFKTKYSIDNKEYVYFTRGWEEVFDNSNSYEKAIYSLKWYYDYLPNIDKRIELIPFEKFVLDPSEYLDNISNLLEVPITKEVKKEMKRQHVPRERLADSPDLEIYRRCGWEPPKYFSEEKELEARRELISQNISSETLKILDDLSENYSKNYQT